jgi:hypothetical protein
LLNTENKVPGPRKSTLGMRGAMADADVVHEAVNVK